MSQMIEIETIRYLKLLSISVFLGYLHVLYIVGFCGIFVLPEGWTAGVGDVGT